MPGENVYDARNDSNYGGLGIPVLKLAEVLHSGLCRWLWDRTGSDGTFLKIVWHNTVAPVDTPYRSRPPGNTLPSEAATEREWSGNFLMTL